MKENKSENLLWIIFTIIGALFILIGLTLVGNVLNYENKENTVGIITEISTHRGINDNIDYRVYVSYNVDGRTYESELSGYSSSFYKGKEINIYYDKSNSTKIGMRSLDLLFLMFPGFGLIFFAIGGTGLLIKSRNKKLEKSLKENGDAIYADYVETIVNNSYSVNGIHPYRIICEWSNPLDNKKYIFKSKNIWINPEDIIIERDIQQFPVYINRDNMKKYVVDIDILENNEG